jgi:hypothetical protein
LSESPEASGQPDKQNPGRVTRGRWIAGSFGRLREFNV